jgi:hypothetical protein
MNGFILWLFLPAILLSACAPWTMVGGAYLTNSENYEVNLPSGWRKHNQSRDALRITRDGLTVQQITIGRWPLDKDPPHTKKKLAPGMLPQEAAEVVVDDFRSNSGMDNYQLTENNPSRVGGHAGFKLAYGYQTKAGLKKKGIYYGVLLDKWLYFLMYEAPERHYFGKDHEVFEKLKESFRILKTGQA